MARTLKLIAVETFLFQREISSTFIVVQKFHLSLILEPGPREVACVLVCYGVTPLGGLRVPGETWAWRRSGCLRHMRSAAQSSGPTCPRGEVLGLATSMSCTRQHPRAAEPLRKGLWGCRKGTSYTLTTRPSENPRKRTNIHSVSKAADKIICCGADISLLSP